MFSRRSSVLVVVFWLAAMSWLVRTKILPSLLVGRPPSYQQIAASGPAQADEVTWQISLHGRKLGWARTRLDRTIDGVLEFHNRVHLERLPLAELAPPFLAWLLQRVDDGEHALRLHIGMDATSMLQVDPLGRPIGFQSQAGFGHRPPEAPARDLLETPDFKVTLRGTVEGEHLRLYIRYGETVSQTSHWLPPDALMSDALAPLGRLPGLRVGQTWSVPVYSPFRSPSLPLDLLHARVVRDEPIEWHGRLVHALLVEYHADAGSNLSNGRGPRARAWVAPDGRVLRQELSLAGAWLRFDRVPERVRTASTPQERPAPEGTSAARASRTPPP
jgi:hypothetical protein